jgi:hypothetical protein
MARPPRYVALQKLAELVGFLGQLLASITYLAELKVHHGTDQFRMQIFLR